MYIVPIPLILVFDGDDVLRILGIPYVKLLGQAHLLICRVETRNNYVYILFESVNSLIDFVIFVLNLQEISP